MAKILNKQGQSIIKKDVNNKEAFDLKLQFRVKQALPTEYKLHFFFDSNVTDVELFDSKGTKLDKNTPFHVKKYIKSDGNNGLITVPITLKAKTELKGNTSLFLNALVKPSNSDDDILLKIKN